LPLAGLLCLPTIRFRWTAARIVRARCEYRPAGPSPQERRSPRNYHDAQLSWSRWRRRLRCRTFLAQTAGPRPADAARTTLALPRPRRRRRRRDTKRQHDTRAAQLLPLSYPHLPSTAESHGRERGNGRAPVCPAWAMAGALFRLIPGIHGCISYPCCSMRP
jgi:hypothetical protein